mgnify:CR=1 FL=1
MNKNIRALDITLDKQDSNVASIKVKLNEADYQSKVDEKIKDYSKKAQIKGFRPGKVPQSLVKKMYGKSEPLRPAKERAGRLRARCRGARNLAAGGRGRFQAGGLTAWRRQPPFQPRGSGMMPGPSSPFCRSPQRWWGGLPVAPRRHSSRSASSRRACCTGRPKRTKAASIATRLRMPLVTSPSPQALRRSILPPPSLASRRS